MSNLPPTVEELETLFHVSVPLHQEFFNRLVEAYPRAGNGHLGSIRGAAGNARAFQLEMFLLRNFAEFPIHFQRVHPSVPLLTTRFRRNVATVIDTLGSVVQDDFTRARVCALSACPSGEHAPERDLSAVSTSRLWAVEVVRLQGAMTFEADVHADVMAALYDTYTFNWLTNGVAVHLGVQVVHGAQLIDRANSVYTDLGGF
ncbi:hypothetical protein VNI00_016639 [Paramarasmius palmivorus]|uniref:Uncharacterized protein n=1 Tax=Paramarasmius palmivorus TaxID=297713 RepID=A0AAW0BB31_9AGAR